MYMRLYRNLTCLKFAFVFVLTRTLQGSNNVELPFSAWAFSSTILFGIILIFYVDSIAEERYAIVSYRSDFLLGGLAYHIYLLQIMNVVESFQ